jgi:Zn-dependent protease
MTFIVVLIGWIFSLCLHEFSHALVAYYGGDTSVREKGYLTFNPLKYTHPVYSLLMPLVFLMLGGIGLPGGAVYIDRFMIRDRRMRSLMSAGGILAQSVLILIMLIPYHLFAGATSDAHPYFWGGYAFLIFLSIFSIFINLIPVPGIDGYGILEPYLPLKITNFAEKIRPYGFLIFYLILLTHNPISAAVYGAATGLTSLAGVDFYLVGFGSSMARLF